MLDIQKAFDLGKSTGEWCVDEGLSTKDYAYLRDPDSAADTYVSNWGYDPDDTFPAYMCDDDGQISMEASDAWADGFHAGWDEEKSRHMINVIFEGGSSRFNPSAGVNYMLAKAHDKDGDEIELYAEVAAPDDWAGRDPDEIAEEEMERFDKESYNQLKAEILRQAEKNQINPDALDFPWG